MREAKVIIVVGGRGSGKTYLLENTLKKSETVVIELAKTDRWEGYKKIYFREIASENFDYKKIANKSIVFEDATAYLSSNLGNKMKEILIFSKQLGSDIFIVFHSINVIPVFMWYLFNAICLFTSSKPRQTATNKEYFDKILEAWSKCKNGEKYHYEIIESGI